MEDKSSGSSKFQMRIRHCPYCGGEGVVPISEKFSEREIIEFIVYLRYRHCPQVKYCPTCGKCYVVFGIGEKTIQKVRRGEYDERWSFLF